MVFGFFRQPVVGSVDAIHQPRVVPRPGRFRAVESGVVPASLSPGIVRSRSVVIVEVGTKDSA